MSAFDKTKNGNTLFDDLNALEGRVSNIEEGGGGGGGSTPVATGVTEDTPKTLGEYYCIRKAQELIQATAYLAAAMNVPSHSYSAGDTIKGVPYSSTRVDNTFVPNYVSLETFITAVSDPNSYAYTKDPGFGYMGQLYYGVVCAVFVCHCLGAPLRHRNFDMFSIDGMELVQQQNAQAFRIGYWVNDARGSGPHARLCIGVKRNNGVVTHVTLAESVQPVCRAVEYTAEEINTMLQTYLLLRYKNLDKNVYHPEKSPYNKFFINKTLMPKKGNKANWSTTEDVIIDILNKGDFTQYVVVKDGVEASPVNIGSGSTINLGRLPFGKYSMYFKNNNSQSAPVEWIVVDMQMSAVAQSGGIVRFTYSSANATPICCAWGRSDYMLQLMFDLTDEDIATGIKDTSLSTEHLPCYGQSGYSGKGSNYEAYHAEYAAGTTKIYPRMMFETEFGVISTDWPSTEITYID